MPPRHAVVVITTVRSPFNVPILRATNDSLSFQQAGRRGTLICWYVRPSASLPPHNRPYRISQWAAASLSCVLSPPTVTQEGRRVPADEKDDEKIRTAPVRAIDHTTHGAVPCTPPQARPLPGPRQRGPRHSHPHRPIAVPIQAWMQGRVQVNSRARSWFGGSVQAHAGGQPWCQTSSLLCCARGATSHQTTSSHTHTQTTSTGSGGPLPAATSHLRPPHSQHVARTFMLATAQGWGPSSY